MPSLNQITPAQLARQIGTPDAPIIIDLRLDEDFADDPRVIPTAKRHSHTTMPEIAVRFAGRQVVVACLRGAKISEGAAAMLRCNGIAAESLAGGHLAWVSAGLPVVRSEILPGTGLWVTRHRPKVDRIACPWLIRRFINPEAQFLFVAPSEVPGVAERFNAIPFDIEDTFWSHRGAECTFDTMIKEFSLATEPLDRLAKVVRAADTDDHAASPQAAGLLALSVGLSRMYRDDLQQLQAGMTIYDALYRWARDGHEEGHDWPAGRAK